MVDSSPSILPLEKELSGLGAASLQREPRKSFVHFQQSDKQLILFLEEEGGNWKKILSHTILFWGTEWTGE